MSAVPVDMSIPGIVHDFTATSSITGFAIGFAYLVDRGLSSSVSASPISYQTIGTSPNRIFKLEIKNAGFDDDPIGTDFVDYQIWIYETTSVVEFHFGSSQVSATEDYFETGAGPVLCLLKDADINSGSSGTLYYLDGYTKPVSIDSLTLPAVGIPSNVLPAWPSSGTVYRFTPKLAACPKPAATFTAANVSTLAARFTFTASGTGLDSLVWDFGDMQKQKVVSAFTTPVTHTYTAAGRYNASVTAYNRCGSTRATASQVKVAVADVPGLSAVRVYPSIVDEALTIEGLSSGATISLYSATGQLVRQLTSTSGNQSVNLAGLPAGAYLIRMTEKNGAQGTSRITKR